MATQYKGIEMPANNADKIGAMIQSAKNKLTGGVAGDFAKGFGAIGGIPKTIVAGTQASYGANIPTVAQIEKASTDTIKQGNVAGQVVKALGTNPVDAAQVGTRLQEAGTGVSRIFNNVNTPTFGAAVNQPLLNMVKEGATRSTPVTTPAVQPPLADKPLSRPVGDPNFFSGGTTFQPSAGLGATPSDTKWTEKDLADWKARGALSDGKSSEYLALEKERSNPNNAMFKEVADKIKDISTFLSGDPLTRKYQIQEMGALKGVLNELGPLTSYGNFGVAGMHDETTQRGQDLVAETSRRGQDITAEHYRIGTSLKADENAMNALYQAGLLEIGKEKNGIEKMKADAKNPENFLKYAASIAPKITTIDPTTGAEKESHDLAAGVKMLTDIGFETPKGFKAPSLLEKPIITPEQAKAEIERRKAQKK